MSKKKIPPFSSERQEAAWWDENRETLDQEFVEAAKKGRLPRLTRPMIAERIKKATRVVSIRLAEEDLDLARRQAAHMGLPYQTYIKSLPHEALRRGRSR